MTEEPPRYFALVAGRIVEIKGVGSLERARDQAERLWTGFDVWSVWCERKIDGRLDTEPAPPEGGK